MKKPPQNLNTSPNSFEDSIEIKIFKILQLYIGRLRKQTRKITSNLTLFENNLLQTERLMELLLAENQKKSRNNR